MITWIAKWPDGTISIVSANNKTEAFWILDREGSPTEAEVYQVTSKSFHIMANAKQKEWHKGPEINFSFGKETSKRKIKFEKSI
jgi:hypothetical protein